jgi:predicted amidohydrolase YtcJ
MTKTARRRLGFAALGTLVIIVTVFFLTRSRHADSLYIGGAVHTLDSLNRTVEAIAVEGGKIVGLGSSEELNRRYDADTTIHLEGRTVIPGFVDAHGRLLGAGLLALTLDLSGARSVREAALMVRRHAQAIPAGLWVRGRGWKNSWWDNESALPRAVLDEAAAGHPAILVGEDGQTAWVNSLALQSAGIGPQRTEHEPATIVRDRKGEPIGILLGEASAVCREAMPPPSEWELNAALDSAARLCLRNGITTIHDFGVTFREIELYQKRIAEGKMPIRVYAVIGGPGQTWDSLQKGGPLVAPPAGWLGVEAIELYVDGSLESHSAALMEPYADEPRSRGITVADEKELGAATRQALERGFHVCLNARGDRALRIALNALSQALGAEQPAGGRIRIEGLQLATQEDLARVRAMGITLSMQPSQYMTDFDVALRALGAERMGRFMPWQEAIDQGLNVAGGTDLPIGPPDPFLGIAMVVSRASKQQGGPPARDVRVSALRMFTAWSAAAGREQMVKGTLEEGKVADFLVLSADPLTVAPEEIANIRVMTTVLGGRVVSTSNAP